MIRDLAFEFLENSAAITDPHALLADLQRRLLPYGFDHLMMTNLPSGQADVRPLVMLQGWPEAWFERYVEKQYYKHDAVTLNAFTSRDPFRWASLKDQIEASRAMANIAGEAREFGMTDGLLVPMHAPRGWQAVISLSSSMPVEISPQEEAAILLTAHLANRAARKLMGEPPINMRLSPREREVVSWMAAGKTSWEISAILSISESRVRRIVEITRDKLGVSTAPQIVAEALRLNEISY